MATETRKKLNVPITKPALGEAEARAPFDSIKSGWVTQGPKVAEFEKAVAAYVGAKHGVATTSCTTGLHLALATAGIGQGDEVIVPSFTFIASANAILYTGATAVFCEIDPRTFNIDPNDVEKRISKKTKAIMPIDQIGLGCDIDAINAIAKKHGLDVVEDAAPAIGEDYKGRKVGSNAHQTVFSFHPRKVITTGDGGMLTTRDPELDRKFRLLRQHGMSVPDTARHVAGPLEHVQVQAAADDPDMHPAVAGRDRGPGGLASAADLILRDPWGYEMRAVVGQFPDLLHKMGELVEFAAVRGRKMPERPAVGAGAEMAGRQAAG